MTLNLEITAAAEARPGDATRHRFDESGGTIGRAATNAWVLSHNKVSGQHAQITFRNGVFYIQDTSRNGVSVNSPENRLVRNRPYALKAGDRIYIEPYEIDVWIDAGSERPARAPRADPFSDDDPFAALHAPPPLQDSGPLPSPVNDEVDPLKFFDPVGGRSARKADPPVIPSDDLLGSHYQPPAVLPGPAAPPPSRGDSVAIPQGYDPLSPDEPVFTPPPRPAPPPPPPAPPAPPPSSSSRPPSGIRPRPGGDSPEARKRARESSGDSTVRQPSASADVPAAPPPEPVIAPPEPIVAAPPPAAPPRPGPLPGAAGHGADLTELLAGAGVPEAVITPELSRNLGQILRIVVSGLMDVLQSRQRIKEEFRMQQTMFRPLDNNPLKFSANLEDALHNLLVKRNAAYLAPVDAFADAFDDLRDHQLAMLAGMRVAFEAMLADFDADKLQEEFDAQLGKVSLPLMPAKMRYWELYREKRQEMSKDPEETFARLFSERFRRAYEEQFRKLKAARRGRGHPPSEG